MVTAEVAQPVEVKIPVKDIAVIVKDTETGLPLPDATVTINGPGGNLTGLTDASGQVIFKALTVADYLVSGILNGINTETKQIPKINFDTDNQQVTVSLSHHDPRFTLIVNVHDNSGSHTGNTLLLNVINNTQNTSITTQTRLNDSAYSVQLPAAADFTISGKKAGYISNIEKVSTVGLDRSTTLYVKLVLGIEEVTLNKNITLKNIYYDSGSAAIRASASPDLEKLAGFLKDNPDIRIEIASYTDSRGNNALNLKLSQARAQQVVNYLQKNGIDKIRMVAKGYGAIVLVNGCKVGVKCTLAQHAQNRRTEFKMIRN